MIGVIGLGNMGHGIAATLIRKGEDVMAFDIDPGRVTELARAGGHPAESSGEVARTCQTILLSLPSSPVTVAVIQDDIIPEVTAGSVVIDTGTTVVRETRRMSAALRERGAHLLDAPVSGGPDGAAQGTLFCFVGGDHEIADSRWTLLGLIAGSRLTHCGPSGAGQVVKGVNQLAMGLVEASYAEAMAYGVTAGVDPATLVDALADTSGWRAALGRLGTTIASGEGENLNCKYSEYDYFLDEADRVGFDAPILRAVKAYLSRFPETHIDNINRRYPPIWSALTGEAKEFPVPIQGIDGVTITRDHQDGERVLTPEAQRFLAALHREFNPRRQALLLERHERQQAIDAGGDLDVPAETSGVRSAEWRVAPCPADLADRRVEITGPCDRKMMINALNSGAKVFMADCEDAQSPTWENQVSGQVNLMDAVRGSIRLEDPARGKTYELGESVATLLVRPRGWHLDERHVVVDGEPLSGSLFDFGLYFFHNAAERIARGTGPYYYLAKLENYLEARLWNDVFVFSQNYLGLPQGSIRATVLIETIHASHQMEEILFELKDHMSGLNAGRWDYIFSCIKTFRNRKDVVFPDRSQIGMTAPFMNAYTERLVQVCHKRGAHAIGGMAAFIPNRRDPEVTERALASVHEDKRREAAQGFDGTWVAHPDLVPVAMQEFNAVLGGRPNQTDRQRDDVRTRPGELTDFSVPDGKITEDGVRLNISVGILYLNAWLMGNGAAALNNLMEDAATSEISRAQLWQWIHSGAHLDDGRPVTLELYRAIRDDELAKIGGGGRIAEAARVMDELVESEEFTTFLTLPAYALLE